MNLFRSRSLHSLCHFTAASAVESGSEVPVNAKGIDRVISFHSSVCVSCVVFSFASDMVSVYVVPRGLPFVST